MCTGSDYNIHLSSGGLPITYRPRTRQGRNAAKQEISAELKAALSDAKRDLVRFLYTNSAFPEYRRVGSDIVKDDAGRKNAINEVLMGIPYFSEGRHITSQCYAHLHVIVRLTITLQTTLNSALPRKRCELVFLKTFYSFLQLSTMLSNQRASICPTVQTLIRVAYRDELNDCDLPADMSPEDQYAALRKKVNSLLSDPGGSWSDRFYTPERRRENVSY